MIDNEYVYIINLVGHDYMTGEGVIELESDWSLYGSGSNGFFEPRRLCTSQLHYYMQLMVF
jgi:hypothetical protein